MMIIVRGDKLVMLIDERILHFRASAVRESERDFSRKNTTTTVVARWGPCGIVWSAQQWDDQQRDISKEIINPMTKKEDVKTNKSGRRPDKTIAMILLPNLRMRSTDALTPPLSSLYDLDSKLSIKLN
jgi:hypothetical protein